MGTMGKKRGSETDSEPAGVGAEALALASDGPVAGPGASLLAGFGAFEPVALAGPEAAPEAGEAGEASEAGSEARSVMQEPAAALLSGLLAGLVRPAEIPAAECEASVLGLPVEALPKLSPWVLHLRFDGVAFVLTTSRAAYEQARAANVPAFVGGELLVMAFAAQNDRYWPLQLRESIKRKQHNPAWRLTRSYAVGAVFGLDALKWTLGEMLERLECTLVSAEVNA